MWINSKEKMPEDMEVVIALYLGHWPGRGNSGLADIYAVDGEWFNIPEGVAIVGWMPVPDTGHLPITEHYADQNVELGNLLGSTETDVPSIFECIFEGDHSEIKPKETAYESAGSGPVNPDNLDAEEQKACFEQFADEMWRQPTQEEDTAFVKHLGKGTLVGLDENDNLVCSVMVKASGSKDYYTQLPDAVAKELEVMPGDRVEFCIGDAMITVWKYSTGKK